MPRPRKHDDNGENDDSAESRALSLKESIAELDLPSAKIKGEPNPEYYRVKMQRVNDMMLVALARGDRLPFNYESAIAGIKAEAKLAGFTESMLADRRTDSERTEDAIKALLDQPDDFWALTDADCELIDKGLKNAIEHIEDVLNERRELKGLDEDEILVLRARAERGKAMRSRIKAMLRLRTLIRHPGRDRKMDQWGVPKYAPEIAAPLLYMLYAHRSNTDSMAQTASNGTQSHVLMIGRHHARFAVTTWMGLNGVRLTPMKILLNHDHHAHVVLIAPPGTGKSEYLMSVVELDICRRPRAQWAYLHAVAEQAQSALGYIQQAFSPNTPVGKRRAALFPNVMLDDCDNNKTKMRVKLSARLKSPTIIAAGVTAKALGSNTDRQARDDVVPQSDRDQPTERERRKQIMGGTWSSRQRGGKCFTIDIGTMWHPDDYLCDLVRQAKRGKLPILVDIQRCGGPVATEWGPPFFPLWPEVYPKEELRRRYEQMGNRAMWSAAYEANPLAEDMQVIRALRYYDPTDKEHDEFLASALFHVSVDPTATNRETSDKAGLVYAAMGEISRMADNGSERTYESRVRILDAQQNHVNQVELADHVARYALQHPVWKVHVETRSGYHATADILENTWGLTVERHDPTNIKKMVRLKQCAGLIDDSMPGMRAVVEFPGRRDEHGKIGPDPARWGWLYDQFLRFGFADDHVVDALSQLLNHFIREGDLVAGVGEASESVRRAITQTGDPRVIAMLNSAKKQSAVGGSPGVEEEKWAQARWGENGYHV